MRRRQLFEFGDQPWLPYRLRALLRDYLQAEIVANRLYAPIVPKLKRALERTGTDRIVDLASGGGATIRQMQEWLRSTGCRVSVVATDRYPGVVLDTGGEPSGADPFHYVREPVDARQIPPTLLGFRTMFTSFHHFPPLEAAAILRAAVSDDAPIAIFEFTERSVANLVGMLASPIAVICKAWNTLARSRGRLFWTYVLPVVPLLYWWDGTISHLRTYSPKELAEMVDGLSDAHFAWDIGQIRGRGYAVTYLIGIPVLSVL